MWCSDFSLKLVYLEMFWLACADAFVADVYCLRESRYIREWGGDIFALCAELGIRSFLFFFYMLYSVFPADRLFWCPKVSTSFSRLLGL